MRRRRWWLAAALLPVLLGCKQTPGTYVVLNFKNGNLATSTPIFTIKVNLLLSATDGTGSTSDATSFDNADGSEFNLPTSGTLIIRGGEGDLTVSARALDKDSNPIGTGSGFGRVSRNQTVEIDVAFSSDVPDGGSNSPEAGLDAQTTSDSLTGLASGGMGGNQLTGTGGTAGSDLASTAAGGQSGSGSGGSTGGPGGGGQSGSNSGGSTGGPGGAGSGAALALSPNIVDFTTVTVDTASQVVFTLINNGNNYFTTPEAVVSGSTFFRIENNQCSNTSLGPYAQCTFTLVFAPTEIGFAKASITAKSGGASSKASTVSGTGKRVTQLAIQFAGSGRGTVNGPGIIAHSSNTFTKGFLLTDPTNIPKLTLSAAPDTGSRFSIWSGDCSGPGNCTLDMSKNRTVTVNFVEAGAGQLSISVLGYNGQQGKVVSSDGTISCSTNCPGLPYSGSDSLTLIAQPDPTSSFIGWSDGPCYGTNPTCTFPAMGSVNITATFGPRSYMFVSSGVYIPGQWGGISGADAKCQGLADSAGLFGTYKAWLSTKGTPAKSRVGSGGWVRTDGRPFARNSGALALPNSKGVYYPPRVDEKGRDLGNFHISVATGGRADGTVELSQCSDYTSQSGGLYVGDAASGSGSWAMTQFDPNGCGRAYHLYCFRSDALTVDITPAPVSGRLVFVSSQPYALGGGLGGADSQCQFEAAAAKATNGHKFYAFIATGLASAMNRISAGGAPWKRVDDVFVVRSITDFANGQLIAPLALGADGSPIANPTVWTGSSDPNSLGTTTCSDWTLAAATSSAFVGNANTTAAPDWFGIPNAASTCNDSGTHLICIEP